MLVPTLDGSIGSGPTVLIIGIGIPVLTSLSEASTEWNGNELGSSILEVDRSIGPEVSEVGIVWSELVWLCDGEKKDGIPEGADDVNAGDVSDNDCGGDGSGTCDNDGCDGGGVDEYVTDGNGTWELTEVGTAT